MRKNDLASQDGGGRDLKRYRIKGNFCSYYIVITFNPSRKLSKFALLQY